MKQSFHLIKGSTNIPVSMTTSILVHKMGQGPFFALVASGKALLHPPFFAFCLLEWSLASAVACIVTGHHVEV